MLSHHLVTTRSGIDHTGRIIQWFDNKLRILSGMDLQGFVFKCKSPSCGMKSVEVYYGLGVQPRTEVGIFARKFMARFPLLPVEDDVSLQDSSIRENFIRIVIASSRK